MTYPVKNCSIPEDSNFQIDTIFIFITLCMCPEFDSMPYNWLFMMYLMGLNFVLSKRTIEQYFSAGSP